MNDWDRVRLEIVVVFCPSDSIMILASVIHTYITGSRNNINHSGGAVPIWSEFLLDIAGLKFPNIFATFVGDKFDPLVII